MSSQVPLPPCVDLVRPQLHVLDRRAQHDHHRGGRRQPRGLGRRLHSDFCGAAVLLHRTFPRPRAISARLLTEASTSQLNANQSIDNYWIRAIPNTGTTDTTGGVNSAILRYDTAEEIEPTTNATTSVIPLTETDLVPLDNPAAPGDPQVGGVDLAMSLDFSFVSPTALRAVSLIYAGASFRTVPTSSSTTRPSSRPQCPCSCRF